MKNKSYWICNDSNGLYLYCGSQRPVLTEKIFLSEESDGEWIDTIVLDALGINYPKDLELETCIPIKLKIKSKW